MNYQIQSTLSKSGGELIDLDQVETDEWLKMISAKVSALQAGNKLFFEIFIFALQLA